MSTQMLMVHGLGNSKQRILLKKFPVIGHLADLFDVDAKNEKIHQNYRRLDGY